MRDQLETFVAKAAARTEGSGFPPFVKREFGRQPGGVDGRTRSLVASRLMVRDPALTAPFDASTLECPYAYWAAARREAPVHQPSGADWFLVTRQEDVRAVVMRPEVFSSNLVAAMFAGVPIEARSARGRGAVDALATADPPAHTRQRKLVNRTFSVHRIAGREPRIRALATALVDRFIDRGWVEWMDEFAVPLPMTVIAELLELPTGDVPQLRRWSDDAIAIVGGAAAGRDLVRLVGSVVALQTYLADRLTPEWTHPGSGILGDLVRAVGEGPDDLAREEVVAILVQLLTAGNETTTSLIGSAVRVLVEQPDVAATLGRDASRVPAFVEEILRLESPFKGHFRVAQVDTTLGGVAIPAGARLMVCWGAANRDETHYPASDVLDLDRANPKDHVAFGEGIHYCVGAPLARLEARVAVETFLARLPDARLVSGTRPAHLPSVFVRRLAALELEFAPGGEHADREAKP